MADVERHGNAFDDRQPMIDRAEAAAAGKRPLKKDRFVKISDAAPVVDWTLVERAHSQVSMKGYVTNISAEADYHDLYQSNAPSG